MRYKKIDNNNELKLEKKKNKEIIMRKVSIDISQISLFWSWW